ncbi:MAG: hypothetical protein ACXVHL_37955, partial [Solirubrobacteraceae bacterium]
MEVDDVRISNARDFKRDLATLRERNVESCIASGARTPSRACQHPPTTSATRSAAMSSDSEI